MARGPESADRRGASRRWDAWDACQKGWDAHLRTDRTLWPPSTRRRLRGASSRRPPRMIPKENVSDVISAVFDEAVDPRITVVGVGGAGGNVVGALYDSDLNGVETVAVNTDPAGLTKTEADVKILLRPEGSDDPVGAAGEAAESAAAALRESLSSDIVFVVAGLGGAAPRDRRQHHPAPPPRRPHAPGGLRPDQHDGPDDHPRRPRPPRAVVP